MALLLLALAGAFQFQDGFDGVPGPEPGPAWTTESLAWRCGDGALGHAGRDSSFAILEQAPHASAMTFSVQVTPQARQGAGWAVAGIVLRQDDRNYWRLGLVEAPPTEGKRHQIELSEMLDGVWLAQSQPGTASPVLAMEGIAHDWRYGEAYTLRLELTPERLDGFVLGPDGSRLAHIAYELGGRAIATGQPALSCADMNASFDNASVNITADLPTPAAPVFPECDIKGWDQITRKPTGFFETGQHDGKWWLFNPRGEAFYIIGTDHIRYEGHWCETLGYAPYGKNMAEAFPNPDDWATLTISRLKEWGFTALGAGHSPILRHRGLAHMENIGFGATFSSLDDICPKTFWTGIPNVFNPDWPRHCDKMARNLCAPLKDDPWLIGYFIDNELEWYGKDWRAWGLAVEAWKKPADHTGKQAWIALLRRELADPAALKEHWGVEAATWDAAAAITEPAQPVTPRAEATAREWVRLVARRYFEETTKAIRRHDPNHLILGARFAGRCPDLWDIAGEYCDVVSFNTYPKLSLEAGLPAETIAEYQGWAKAAAKPMMVTEWSFPALDTPCPSTHGAGMRVDTQTQRARCFSLFQEALFSFDFMVGSDYFMFMDEPPLGISKEFPENSNYGLVSNTNEPYRELTEAAKALNPRAFELHMAGEVKSAPPVRLVPWLTAVSGSPETPPSGSMRLEGTAGLTLEGPVNGGWSLTWNGKELGDWHPNVHQKAAVDMWNRPGAGRVTATRKTPEGTIVDFEAVYEGEPSYKGIWRLFMPSKGDTPWFASQCVSIQNTSAVPWRLVHELHYLTPRINGDIQGDKPLALATQYYITGAAWVDAAAKLGVGCWVAPDSGFLTNYWTDESGGYHSDVFREVEKSLAPGETCDVNGPLAFFYPIAGADLPAFSQAARATAKAVGQP